MRVDVTEYFFAFVCVSAWSTEENSIPPSSVRDHNLLRPCVTIHNPQVSEWRKKTFWLQQYSNNTFHFKSHTTPSSNSDALEIFVSGIPKTQQRPSMIDLLPGQHRGSLMIVALRGFDTYWSYWALLQKHQRNAKLSRSAVMGRRELSGFRGRDRGGAGRGESRKMTGRRMAQGRLSRARQG
jgi:hypothetical protein